MQKNVSVFRIDERVFLAMTVTAVISLIVLAFRYKDYTPCATIKISTSSPENYQQNSLVSFKAETAGGKKFEWDFGDHQQNESGTSTTTHAYTHEGEYIVTVKVDGREQCTVTENVYIRRMVVAPNTDLVPKVVAPSQARINQQVTFTDTTPDATSWTWQLGENNRVDTNRVVRIAYTTPGVKTILLTINGRPDRTIPLYLQVYPSNEVHPKPNPYIPRSRAANPYPVVIKDSPTAKPLSSEPEKPSSAEIRQPVEMGPNTSNEQFQNFLKDVIDGKMRAADFAANVCGKLDLPVLFNKKRMRFSDMCLEIKNYKKKRIQKSHITLFIENGCIKDISLEISKGFL